jgi:hypothetical protein
VPARLFLFLQFEFPWQLGPPDGRYLLRSGADAEPERVVVLGTLGATPRVSGRVPGLPIRRRSRRRRVLAAGPPEPTQVATSRVTIVDPVPLSAERQARAWLDDLDTERDASAAVVVLNRVLRFHRIASADPYIHELSPAQALVIRAGWGEGEQVADGRWLHARELPWTGGTGRSAGARRRGGDRSAALRPQERLAELLGARGEALLCEDLVLRARLDLDHGRVAHAAIELDAAYAAALGELRAEQRQDLAIRIDELDKLRLGVAAQARAALPRAEPRIEEAQARPIEASTVTERRPDAAASTPQEEIVRHALERLEAALRARTATGFRLK